MTTITAEISFTVVSCSNCGFVFGLPANFDQECYNNRGKIWFCPAGHPQTYLKKGK